MVGRLGDDEFGHQFLARLRIESIAATHVVLDDEAGTGVGLPLVEESGENSIVIVPRANHRLTPADIARAAPDIAGAGVLLLQLELPVDTAVAAAKIGKQAGSTVVLNPAPALYRPSSSSSAASSMCSCRTRWRTERCVTQRARRRRRSPPPNCRGDWGSPSSRRWADTAASSRRTVRGSRSPPTSCRVVDTVGAGDAFCGVLGAWLNAGAALPEAVVHANAAGALAVTRAGAELAMPHRQSIVDLAAADHDHYVRS